MLHAKEKEWLSEGQSRLQRIIWEAENPAEDLPHQEVPWEFEFVSSGEWPDSEKDPIGSWEVIGAGAIANVLSSVMAARNAAEELLRKLHERSVTAIIEDQPVGFESIPAKFEALSKAWRRHIRGKSIINYAHPAYFQIVAMGPAAIPPLLEEVSKGAGTWYPALQYITGEMPESPDMRGNPEAMRSAWLKWGIVNGYWRKPHAAPGND